MMAFEMSLEGQMRFEPEIWGCECPWDTHRLVQGAVKRAGVAECPAPRAWHARHPLKRPGCPARGEGRGALRLAPRRVGSPSSVTGHVASLSSLCDVGEGPQPAPRGPRTQKVPEPETRERAQTRDPLGRAGSTQLFEAGSSLLHRQAEGRECPVPGPPPRFLASSEALGREAPPAGWWPLQPSGGPSPLSRRAFTVRDNGFSGLTLRCF